MEGHLDFYMDNEERMDLKGALTIVEGRYDFALGQFLRKRFEAQPGGRLEWDGDVYEGQYKTGQKEGRGTFRFADSGGGAARRSPTHGRISMAVLLLTTIRVYSNMHC